MQNLVTDSEKVKRAVQYISEIKKQKPEMALSYLLEDASLRFDLSPLESNSLHRILIENS